MCRWRMEPTPVRASSIFLAIFFRFRRSEGVNVLCCYGYAEVAEGFCGAAITYEDLPMLKANREGLVFSELSPSAARRMA